MLSVSIGYEAVYPSVEGPSSSLVIGIKSGQVIILFKIKIKYIIMYVVMLCGTL